MCYDIIAMALYNRYDNMANRYDPYLSCRHRYQELYISARNRYRNQYPDPGTRFTTQVPGSKSLPELFCQKTCRYSVLQQQYTVLQILVNCGTGNFTHIYSLFCSESDSNIKQCLLSVACFTTLCIYLFIHYSHRQPIYKYMYVQENFFKC